MTTESSKIGSRRFNLNDRAAILLLLVFSAALVAPAAYFGIPDNYDLGQHLRFAQTWNQTLSEGSIFAAWGAVDNAGLGSPGVRFYPPANHMLMGLLQIATGSWYDTLWITMLIWMFIGSIGVYKLASEWLTPETAFCSSLLYGIVPYHLLQVFQAFLLAEFAAAAILPFCFLYAHRLINAGGTKNILLFAFSYAGLILAHIPSTIIGSLSLGVFVLCFLSKRNFLRSFAGFATSGVTALALTAFYWVRMASELAWVKHNTSEYYSAGFYNYSTYLFPMIISAGDDYVPRFLWLMDICILLTIFLFIPAIIVALIRRKGGVPRFLIAFLSTGFFTVFMMSVLSTAIWDNVSLIQKLQFAFRWLSATSVIAAIVFPAAVACLIANRKTITRPFAYGLALVITMIIVVDMSQIVIPSAPVPRERIQEIVDTLNEKAGCECWWPIWAKPGAMKEAEPVVAGTREVKIESWEAGDRRFTIETGESTSARIATFYYPYWKAEINGQEIAPNLADDGAMTIPLSAERSDVRLYFAEPAKVTVSRYLSASALAVWLLAFTAIRIRRKRAEEGEYV